MSDILNKIVSVKRDELAQALERRSLSAVRADAESRVLTRDFEAALRGSIARGRSAVIAEVKKASPSKGVLRADFEPADIAQSYAEHGASCLSVLTDRQFFQGSVDFLKQARASCQLPVLRKDFLIDPYQVYESRAMGADAILLIAACLDDAQMRDMEAIARGLYMSVLVEVHDAAELERVLALDGVQLIGINNRNLATFDTDLATTEQLTAQYGDQIRAKGALLVSESGLLSRDDLDRVQSAGADAVLVGESLMRQPDVTAALEALIGGH